MNNKKKLLMAGIFFGVLSSIFSFYCKSSIPPKRSSNFLGYIVKYKVPTLINENDSDITYISDSQYVFFLGNSVIYKFPYIHEFTRNIMDANGNKISTATIKKDTNYRYLVYEKMDTHGYTFDSRKALSYEKVKINSFLNMQFHIDEKFLYKTTDILIKRDSNKKNSTFSETYFRKEKNEKWDCDTNLLVFDSEIPKIDFSISKSLDSSKKAKLVGVTQVFLGDSTNTNPFFKKKRMLNIELREIKYITEKEIGLLDSLIQKTNELNRLSPLAGQFAN